MEVTGTNKQRRAIAILAESGGNKTMGEVMREAGYSAVSANSPTKLTKSKLFARYSDSIPDSLVRSKHLALLKKKNEDGSIDTAAVRAGVEMAYKIKGYFAPEQQTNIGEVVIASFRNDSAIAKLVEHNNGIQETDQYTH